MPNSTSEDRFADLENHPPPRHSCRSCSYPYSCEIFQLMNNRPRHLSPCIPAMYPAPASGASRQRRVVSKLPLPLADPDDRQLAFHFFVHFFCNDLRSFTRSTCSRWTGSAMGASRQSRRESNLLLPSSMTGMRLGCRMNEEANADEHLSPDLPERFICLLAAG